MEDREYKDAWQELKVEMTKQLDIESERLKRAKEVLEDNLYNSYIIGKISGQRIVLINILLSMTSLDGTNEFSNLLSDLEDK